MGDNLTRIIDWIANGAESYLRFPWTCSFCGRDTTITSEDRNYGAVTLARDNVSGRLVAVSMFVVCPNPDCKKFSLHVLLYKARMVQGRGYTPADYDPLSS